MLKTITLKNYKSFKEITSIDIAPLTIFCGANSGGKSSILKSLLMLKQSNENESASQSMLFTGDYVDNGSFDDIVYHKNKEEINKDSFFDISTEFLIRDTSDKYGKNPIKRQDIVSFKELKRVFYNTPNIKKVKYFKINVSIEVHRPKSSTESFVFYTESNIIKNYNITLKLLDIDKHPIDDTRRYIYVEKIKNEENDKNAWYLTWNGIPSTSSKDEYNSNIAFGSKCTCYFSGLQVKNIYVDNMKKQLRNTLPNMLSIFKIAAFQTSGINFIAPLREHPIRRYYINGNINSVGISGEKTPILLAKEQNSIKTDAIPPVEKDNKIIWRTQKSKFIDLVKKWMNYLSLGEVSLSGANGLVEMNINGHNIADVGFGVSQSLPIIVQGLYMIQDESLILEQPEIHLHPEMQLHMADFLIALAKNEKNIIVETHSDHVINRIIHRVMENYDELNPLINIYIVEKDQNDVSHVRKKEINRYHGTEEDTNKFFFTQYNSEVSEIIDIGLNNMMEIQ